MIFLWWCVYCFVLDNTALSLMRSCDLELLVLDFVEFVVDDFEVKFSFLILKIVEFHFFSPIVVPMSFVVGSV